MLGEGLPGAAVPRGSVRLVKAASDGSWPAVSVVLPVLNEEHYLRTSVGAILDQNYPGELQVVIALGPSKDRTAVVAKDLAEDPRISIVPNPTGLTPNGLNAAIAASRHPVIARVDGHAVIPPDYLRTAVALLERTGADNVGGLMSAHGVTDIEQAVAWAMTSKLGVGNAPFHVGGREGPADTVYLGVFRRTALDRVGGYDETFKRAQDWEMNFRLRATGGLVWFSPELSVSYRPRGSLKAIAKQYFHYGRWRRHVMRIHPASVSLRYLAPPLAVAGVTAGTITGLVGLGLGRTSLIAGFVLPGGYLSLVIGGSMATSRGLPVRARALLPAVLVTMHMSWGTGFLSSWRPDRPHRR
jgi:succinoglycan biosynthesis protein ExoA